MGKFTSTQYKDLIGGVTDFHKDLLNQDFYLFNSQGKGTEVDYYNINTDESTLDPAAEIAYSEVGVLSPIRYNLIHGLFIYGMPKLETNLENQEFGTESNELSGESYILPGTIKPIDGDFFIIKHAGDPWLFKVIDSTMDTLTGGEKVWKISWKLDRTSDNDINENVIKEFIYNETTDGTNTKRVVELSKYELAKKIDNASSNLKEYFKDLFYSDKVQTLIYKYYNDYNMYDPYAIEFILKNKLLYNTGEKYLHIEHVTKTPKTFGVSYNHSIFRTFELCNKSKLRKYSYRAQADYIEDPTSIFATRYEMYWRLTYDVILTTPNGPLNPRGIIPVMKEEDIDIIQANKKFKDKKYKNIIVKYFNGEDIVESDLETLDEIEVCYESMEAFYSVLWLIFCLDYYTNKLLN